MTAADKALEQLDLLIEEYDRLKARSRYEDLSDLKPEAPKLTTRLEAALDRLTSPDSAYAKSVESVRPRPWHIKLPEFRAIAEALRDDIAAGWLTPVVELAHADTYAGYLEMASGLNDQGYKDPAAAALRHKLGHICQFAFIQAVEIRVIYLANRALGMTSRLNFDEMTFKPADTLLLGLVQDREPAVLRCPLRRRGIKRREPGRRQ